MFVGRNLLGTQEPLSLGSEPGPHQQSLNSPLPDTGGEVPDKRGGGDQDQSNQVSGNSSLGCQQGSPAPAWDMATINISELKLLDWTLGDKCRHILLFNNLVSTISSLVLAGLTTHCWGRWWRRAHHDQPGCCHWDTGEGTRLKKAGRWHYSGVELVTIISSTLGRKYFSSVVSDNLEIFIKKIFQQKT